MFTKQKPYRNQKMRNAAIGEDCTLLSPYCNGDKTTTVLCHLNEGYAGKGMGQKADDDASFFACSGCHDAYDRRSSVSDGWVRVEPERVLRAVILTRRRFRALGIID